MKKNSVEAIAARLVADEFGCLVWTGRKTNGGYGQTMLDARAQLTHRIMYESRYGPIPKGMQIDHLCRNRACANPEHLEAVTQKENSARGLLHRRFVCKRGHVVAGDNLYHAPNGKRICRACRKIWAAQYVLGTGAPKGEAHGCAKLTKDQVLCIRSLYDLGTPVGEIAIRFGIATQSVYHIGLRKNWKSIPEAPDSKPGSRPKQPAKTNCHRGHPFSGENLIISGNERVCRACRRLIKERFRQRQRATQGS